ncbi:hypothetical protein [Deinococcus arboris]|uniref:hypothetical protein n=1 Tax=Deinococcus arboris TaxID=2682977 RepID=UPI0018DBAD93|nr:hypothetical protein [Deinococcus arboris]
MKYTCTVYPNKAPAVIASLVSTAWGGPQTWQGQQWIVRSFPDRIYSVRPHGQGSLVHLSDQLRAYEVLSDQLQAAIKRSTAINPAANLTCKQLGLQDNRHVTFQSCQVQWPVERRFPKNSVLDVDQVGTPLITFILRTVRDDSLQVKVRYTFAELSMIEGRSDCGSSEQFRLSVTR